MLAPAPLAAHPITVALVYPVGSVCEDQDVPFELVTMVWLAGVQPSKVATGMTKTLLVPPKQISTQAEFVTNVVDLVHVPLGLVAETAHAEERVLYAGSIT